MNAPVSTQPGIAIRPRPESPVMSLFHEWLHLREAHARVYQETGEDDPARDLAGQNMIAAERHIVATGSASDRDWIAKICAASNFGVFELDRELHRSIWTEAQALLDGRPAAEAWAPADGAGAGAVPVPGPNVADSASAADTGVLRLFRLHSAIRTAASEYLSATRCASGPPELAEPIYQITDRIEAEMMALASTCAADMAAKMIVSHAGGDLSCLEWDDPVWVEARKLTGIEA